LGYVFKGGTMAIQSQIGNAVPPRLARAIASIVIDALRNARKGNVATGSERPVA
jgi:site-specific DNA-cytosine methylase